MNKKLFLVDLMLDSVYTTVALVDNDTTVYAIINKRFVRRLKLPYINIRLRKLTEVVFAVTEDIEWMIYISIDVDGHYQYHIFFYMMSEQKENVILDLIWMETEEVRLDADHDVLKIESTETIVQEKNQKTSVSQTLRPRELFSIHMTAEICRIRKKSNSDMKIFTASIKDIEKTLRNKRKTDPQSKLPERYYQFLEIFDSIYADSLSVHCPGIDIHIEIEKNVDRTEKETPWGPLYSMSRDKLLILRKTFTELLDKGFIQMSNLSAAMSVFFTKKSDNDLHFCVDYRAFNIIIRKNRYSLPLIQEILCKISKTK